MNGGLNVLFSIRCQNKDVRINTRMEEVSSQQTSKAKNKGIKHQWTKHEDEKLIECLLDLSNSRQWRADNGTFRNGYLQQLERWMHEKIPDCELKGVPHIESRFKLWKSQYNAIFEMLGPSASGFGWSDKNKCVECDKNVYDNWVKCLERIEQPVLQQNLLQMLSQILKAKKPIKEHLLKILMRRWQLQMKAAV
uniref:Myb/SANT-like domain-containing protein n=1 Tax=Ananas comosus var. bracteatus TaxID=296719 RepID=A0A6V7NWK1_ANACO|nr:unnamed protein product [Ananas comosus var. bracteatus]